MHGFLHLSQTNFLALHFAKTPLFEHYKRMRLNVPIICLILITVFISACSSKPKPKITNTPLETIINDVEISDTATKKLELADALNSKMPADEKSISSVQTSINNLLIEASELFILEHNYNKALWLANEVSEIHQDNLQNTYRLLIVKARSLLELNHPQKALNQLKLVNELVTYSLKTSNGPMLKFTIEYYLILSEVYEVQNKQVLAIDAQLNAFSLNPDSTNENVEQLWAKLETLTQWQIAQLSSKNPPFIGGWTQLLNYSHKFGGTPEQYSRYLHLWKQRNPTHPAISIIEQLQPVKMPDNVTEIVVENIAILLPLSGGQKNAGLAAQQGVLAAYENKSSKNISFIDTNEVDWESLATLFANKNIDHVIGPLLKPNVERFLALSLQHDALQIPTLLLNLSTQYQLSEFQFALSMRPEDEAIQSASTLSRKNFTKPIILSHNDRVSKRIALAFNQQWQISTGETVDIVYFEQGKEMQVSLKQSLDVYASQNRIKQLNSRLKNTIKSEARNRRDIDMIYLVGSAAQTRLIKPYIDVNISPFSDIIPVYASSRSHSNFNDKHNISSTNDLDGLTFTQMPWLLNSKQQDKSLYNLSHKLWPKRTDSLSRIFAMGFDSFNLLDKLSIMRKSSFVRHFGQTGVLKLNSNNILTRGLIWGKYNNEKVTQVALD
jgi:outer membrane PBP1 activator LpoA protein